MVVTFHAIITTSRFSASMDGHEIWVNVEQGPIRILTVSLDILFVISGFAVVMTSGSFKSSMHFLLRRLLRIIPLYWLLTSIRVIGILLIPDLFTVNTLEIRHTLASYLFYPVKGPDGTFFPILYVGWSLGYELVFYFIFALFFRFNKYRKVLTIILLFACHVMALSIQNEIPEVGRVAGQFMPGIIMGILLTHRFNVNSTILPIFRPILVLFLTLITFIEVLDLPVFYRGATYSIAALSFVASLASYENFFRRHSAFRFATHISNWTFSIYLVQVFAIPAALHAINTIHADTHPVLQILLAVCLSVFFGMLIHISIESRTDKWISKKLFGYYQNKHAATSIM